MTDRLHRRRADNEERVVEQGQAGFGTPLVIANPSAGRGRSPVLEELTDALRDRGMLVDIELTRAPGHATELARAAVEDGGRRFVIAVGGDGTVHEVVNGMVDASTGKLRGDRPVLGIVGAGSGCDLVRTFGLDRRPDIIADHLVTDTTLDIDVGRVHLLTRDGRPTTRLFVNVAEVGYGGRVVDLANRLPRRLGRARYAAAIVGSVASFRRTQTTIVHDGGTLTESVCNVVVANAQFFGGGLMVAPRALPADGRFNLQSWGGSPIDVVRAQPQMKTGRHLARDDVREWQSAAVEVDAPVPLLVEADGEVIGTTPARFELLDQVLRLKI